MLKRHYGCFFFWRLEKLLVHLYQEIKNIKIMKNKSHHAYPPGEYPHKPCKPKTEPIPNKAVPFFDIIYFSF